MNSLDPKAAEEPDMEVNADGVTGDTSFSFGFDGVETEEDILNGCDRCDAPLHQHERERVYPDDGPTGSWHYTYTGCP